MARLVLSLDGQLLAEYNMSRERYTIGRLPDNDIRIDNAAVSGHHALIINILNDSFLEDLNSTNGTYVNGKIVKKHALQHGDVITVGHHALRFVETESETQGDEFAKTMLIQPRDAAGLLGKDRVQQVAAAAPAPAMAGMLPRARLQVLSGQFAGRELPVGMPAEDEIVLGEDRAGDQVTLRERMRPLLLFMILLMETFSMASLVSTEVVQRTVTAVLVTPARVSDFLAAKAVFGTVLSLGQALVVLALIGGVTAQNWSLLLTTLLIGALMFTGVALFVGSAGRDFMGQLFLAMLVTIPLLIPAVAVLLPGSAAPWVQVIPTYPVIDVLVGATVYGATWADSAGSLGVAAAWLVVLFGAGWITLKRKVESL